MNTTSYRWWIVTLLTLGTIINYLDRIALGILNPVIKKDLNLTDEMYGYVTGAFQLFYTVGFLIMGKFVDGQAGSNTLAYNYFPNHGDMIIDTAVVAARVIARGGSSSTAQRT